MMTIQLRYIPHFLRLAPLLLVLRAGVFATRPRIRRTTTLLHELGIICLCLYLCCVCVVTMNVSRIIHGYFEMGQNYNLMPFHEIIGIARGGDTPYALLNIVGNVLLFLPLGLLPPLLWRGWRAGHVLAVSLMLSGGIEALQLFTGRSADIDDVILNTTGGMVGFALYHILRATCPEIAAGFRLRGAKRTEYPGRGRDCRARPHGQTPPTRRTARADRPAAKHRRGAFRVAFTTAVAALCALASATVLLGGLNGQSTPAGPGASSPSPRLPDIEPAAPGTLDTHAVRSAHILLATSDMSQIILGEKAEQRIYPASLTKMMTAILALERIGDMEEVIPLREGIFTDIYAANLSTAGFLPGEQARALDLVYGTLLPSGAECSVALAEYIAGSEKAFAALMNERARELGMDGTRFINATGSHHPGHYTTARDMALLLSHGLRDPVFHQILASQRYHTAPTGLHPEGIAFASTLFGRAGQTTFPGGTLVGGKTGYTDEAGQCLASFAQIGGREYILVTAGARPEDYRVESLHIDDALAIYGTFGQTVV